MSTPQAKFSQLSKLKYKDQAVWFLNGFWEDGVNGDEANRVWDYSKKFVELDLLGPGRKGEEGNELDQFWSAKFLEDMDSALPAIQRKEALRTIDQDSNGKMSLIEYLVWKYKKGVKETAEAPQGDNREAIRKAQEAVDAVASQMADVEQKIEAQKQAKQENDRAKAANDKAKAENDKAVAENDKAKAENDTALAELRRAERELEQAEQELADAIADLKRQEEDYKNKCDALEAKSKDQSTTVVQRNKAANELAQLKQEDPLPLRKAKITQEAALRKVQKQKKAAEEVRMVAEGKGRELEEAGRKLEDTNRKLEDARRRLEDTRRQLEHAGRELERAIRELEEAYAALEQKMAEAQAELEIIKNKPGGGKGALWWLQRELFEVDQRLPRAKQRFDHTQPFNYNP